MAILLVIGGTGFFGKSILEVFGSGGLDEWDIEKVIVVSRNADKLRYEAPQLITQKIELLSLDITSARELPLADFVIHAAASTDARNYLRQPLQEGNNILDGITNYCRLAKIYHRNSHIIFASSGAVYGQQPGAIETIGENYVINPLGDVAPGKEEYTRTKRIAEDQIRNLGLAGLSVSIARCFAFIGPWLPRDQHFAIGNFIADGLAARPIQVQATHRVYRSYLFADDLVRWLMSIAQHSSRCCPIYNVGSDQSILMGDLAKRIADYFGVAANIGELRSELVDRYVPAITKIRDDLGCSVRYDLSSAIGRTAHRIMEIRSLHA
jgi:dTDP-glucose 4,6-dehydratase